MKPFLQAKVCIQKTPPIIIQISIPSVSREKGFQIDGSVQFFFCDTQPTM